MSWGFERGRIYNRRGEIHARFDGQQQGGIITPGRHNLIIIITGDEGLDHGYADRLRSDGVFEYFGEGQIGDMPWVRGNAAIRDHSANGKDLLLFRKTPAGLRFEAEMLCESWHYEQAPDREGSMRRAIVFELRDLESVADIVEADPVRLAGASIASLREKALAAAKEAPEAGTALRTVYERSRDVRDYVLARSHGSCEGCRSPAPFNRLDGSPYLEPHHLRRLSDGGPDHPRFVIALCPTCHRRVHHGADGIALNARLTASMDRIEQKV